MHFLNISPQMLSFEKASEHPKWTLPITLCLTPSPILFVFIALTVIRNHTHGPGFFFLEGL